MAQRNDKADKLMKVLDCVYKFPHNVSANDLVNAIYGDENGTNRAYRQEKLDLIQRRGVTYWFNDLDLANQRVIAEMMLERYGHHLTEALA